MTPSASKRSSSSCAVLRDAEQVPVARQCDAPGGLELHDEDVTRVLVGSGRDRVPVSRTHEAPLLLEETCELGVVHLHRLEPEPGLELDRLALPLSEGSRRTWPVELRPA